MEFTNIFEVMRKEARKFEIITKEDLQEKIYRVIIFRESRPVELHRKFYSYDEAMMHCHELKLDNFRIKNSAEL